MKRQTLLIVGVVLLAVAAVGAVGLPMLNSTPDDSPDREPPYFIYEGQNLTVQSAAEQVIRGKTNLSAGSEVSVRVRSSDDESPFLKSSTATVSENGTFRAMFNFSDIPEGTSFTVSVRHNESTVMSTKGTVTQ